MDANKLLSSIDDRTAAELCVENAWLDREHAIQREMIAPAHERRRAEADRRAAERALMAAEREAARLDEET